MDDFFQMITEAAPQTEIVHAASYLGMEYSE